MKPHSRSWCKVIALQWTAVLTTSLLALLANSDATFGGFGVWHTAVPLTPNAIVESQGSFPHGLYLPLDLRCNGAAGTCSWLVTTKIQITDGTGKYYDLWLRDQAGNATNLLVSQTSLAGSQYSIPVEVVENGPGGFISRIQADSPTQIPANELIGVFMHSFVLSQGVAQTQGIQHVMAASYYGFQGTGPGTDPGYSTRFTSVANNPLLRHVFLYQEWPNPVIRITNTPEPATAALLLAPAVLLRRRRSRPRSRRVC